MRLNRALNTWAPFVLDRLVDLVDEDLMRQVLTQAIEGIKGSILDSKTKWDDRLVLPILEMMLVIIEERE